MGRRYWFLEKKVRVKSVYGTVGVCRVTVLNNLRGLQPKCFSVKVINVDSSVLICDVNTRIVVDFHLKPTELFKVRKILKS